MIEILSEWRRLFDLARTPYDARSALGVNINFDGSGQLPPDALPGGPYQAQDSDLTAISALTGTNTIYYRSGDGVWTAVAMGGNMTFTAGILNSTAGISDAPSDSVLYGRKNAAWVAVPPAAGGVEEAPEDGNYYGRVNGFWNVVVEEAPNDGNIYVRQWEAWVIIPSGGGGGGITDAPSDSKTYGRKNAAWVDLAAAYQPLDGDLTSLAGASGTNTIYYRSAANTWSAVTIGGNMTFSGGVLNAVSGGGGGITDAPSDSKVYGRINATWTDLSALYQPIGGSGGGFTTGDAKLTFKTVADAGWVMIDNGSIGDASSGATTRANADTSALFVLLFNNITDTYAPLLSSDGFTAHVRADFASAAACFAAHTRLTIPHQLGRILAIAGDGTADGVGSAELGKWDFEFTTGSSKGITFWNVMIKL